MSCHFTNTISSFPPFFFSPRNAVRFKERQKSFAHFLVQLCAIVGGVFTVFGFVAGFLNSGVKFIEKVKMGKNG